MFQLVFINAISPVCACVGECGEQNAMSTDVLSGSVPTCRSGKKDKGEGGAPMNITRVKHEHYNDNGTDGGCERRKSRGSERTNGDGKIFSFHSAFSLNLCVQHTLHRTYM